MRPQFVNFQIHTGYELLNNPVNLEDMMTTAKQQGYRALAIADNDVMYGMMSFYQLAIQHHIRPLLGVTLTKCYESNLTDPRFSLILLAKNQQGLKNLYQLTSIRQMTYPEGIPWSAILPLLEGVVVITKLTDLTLSQELLQQLATVPTAYLACDVRHQSSQNLASLSALANKLSWPLVAVEDVHYLRSEDAFATEVLQAIGTNQVLPDPVQANHNVRVTHDLRSVNDVQADYEAAGLISAIEATNEIESLCQAEPLLRQPQLPAFPLPQGYDTAQDYLTYLAKTGLTTSVAAVSENYHQRLEHELAVIDAMGFADYFLIVWDIVKEAHKRHIRTGPGRGSAAGSLVAYVLGITQVDPLKYDLLFERFLNPERVTMPDIDLDIADRQRDDLIHYVQKRYGREHVAQIITFGTLSAKQVLRDVGRVFGLSPRELTRWSTAFSATHEKNLAAALSASEGLKNLVVQNDTTQLFFDVCQRLEGLPRHYSTHAAGVVLSEQKVVEAVPVMTGQQGLLLTQFSMTFLEKLGLLKIDFLGLRNLTFMDQILSALPSECEPFAHFNLNDEATLAEFAVANTEGVFQFESAGIRQALRRLAPTNFMDIVATNALYRPGPMQQIATYIKRKNNPSQRPKLKDELVPILGETYGVLVYQEQVMKLASVVAGFSLAQADLMRRAISKKKIKELEHFRDTFIQGAVERNYSTSQAQKIFGYIEKFANYGFNKSHAVAYSLLAYQLMYLKVHFPLAFYTALLNEHYRDKFALYVATLKTLHITLHLPDINQSQVNFYNDEKKLWLGLKVIKDLPHDTAQRIVTERQTGGPYRNVQDFIARLSQPDRNLNKLKSLVLVGGLDSLNSNRREVLTSLTTLLESAALSGKSVSLFDVLAPKPIHVQDYTPREKSTYEYQLLGAYISNHPLNQFEGYYRKQGFHYSSHFKHLHQGQVISSIILIRSIKPITTKKGTEMAFLEAEDLKGAFSIIVFPDKYQVVKAILQPNDFYLVSGQVTFKTSSAAKIDQPQLILDYLKPHPQPITENAATNILFLRFDFTQVDLLTKVMKILRQFPGDCAIISYNPENKQKKLFADEYRVDLSPRLLSSLATLIGTENVVAQSQIITK